MKRFTVLLSLLLTCSSWAQDSAPVGLWKTIDDDTGKPKALVRITQANGEFSGRIEKLFRQPEQDQNPICDQCEDARKNQPLIGMVILNGLKRDGDDVTYSGGKIIDPASGKVYRSKMTVLENGRKLDVRGYIGIPALGRTQVWLRE
jgi:uncharacterized protein (DUF2147 family)